MPSHRELNRLFVALDGEAALQTLVFRDWLAWPIVKPQLWHATLAHLSGPMDRDRPAPDPLRVAGRALKGGLELAFFILRPKRAGIAVLYTPRTVADRQGRPMHPHFGRFLERSEGVLACAEGSAAIPGQLNQLFVGALLGVVSRLWRLSPGVRRTARRLTGIVTGRLTGIPAPAIEAVCRDALARFIVKQAVFRCLFRRSGVSMVLVTDPDSKCPEVAAAKACGATVIELQHGMFGSEEPDYSWTTVYRPLRKAMPVADKVLVFGPLWRDALLRNGYWRDEDVICVGNAALSERAAGASRLTTTLPFRVLFPTQYYVRDAAVRFWSSALSLQRESGEPSFDLDIKVHPQEFGADGPYRELARRFPESCRLVPEQTDGLEAMLSADIVAAYTSFMLLEAVGAGRPAVSLCGGLAPEGVAGTFALPELESRIPHVRSAGELLDQLRRWAAEPLAEAAAASNAAAGIFHVPERPFDETLDMIARQHVA